MGDERIIIRGLAGMEEPRKTVTVTITYADGSTKEVGLLYRVDTDTEINYMRNGGVLHYVLWELAAWSTSTLTEIWQKTTAMTDGKIASIQRSSDMICLSFLLIRDV